MSASSYYYYILTFIDIFVLLIVSVFAYGSTSLDTRQKTGFIIAFFLIIIVSLLELVDYVISFSAANTSPTVIFLINYFGFILSLPIPISIAFSLDRDINIKIAVICYILYVITFTALVPSGSMFYLTSNNEYARGDYFAFYTCGYIASLLYMLFSTVYVTRRHQNKRKYLIYPIFAILVVSTSFQIIYPQLHLTWFCVTLLTILFFMYCNEMWSQLDGLTGLLDHKNYINVIEKGLVKKNSSIIIFDIDEFKYINDNYGHFIGDQCILAISECLKTAYMKYGCCYRIGGDEFSVILYDHKNEEYCNKIFKEELDKAKARLSVLPEVSIGSALICNTENLHQALVSADKQMYQDKRERKYKSAN